MIVSVILVNYNCADLLRKCLGSLYMHTREISFEVIVVDNASNDDSVPMIRAEFQNVSLIESPKNLGFSRANNLAAQSAESDYLLFLNTDTRLIDNLVKALGDYLDHHPRVAAVGPRLIFEDGRFQPSAGQLPNLVVELVDKIKHGLFRGGRNIVTPVFNWFNGKIRKVGWVTGACMMVRREPFQDAGGFDEDMFMYFEDKDLCRRLITQGWEVVYFPHTSVIHLLAGSSYPMDQQKINSIYRSSQLHYYQKHLSKLQTQLLLWYLKLAGKL